MAAPSPKYRQIAGRLRDGIRSGRYEPGDQLPSVTALMAEHKVALDTVKKAIRLLVDEGLAYTEQGRGTFVRDPLPEPAQPEMEVLREQIAGLAEQVRQLDRRLTDHERHGG